MVKEITSHIIIKKLSVIVNYTGEAYPEEIIGLEKCITDSVKRKYDIELHPEV